MRRLVSIGEIAGGKDGSIATGPFGSAVSAKHFAASGIPMIRGSNLSTDIGIPLFEDEFVYLPDELVNKFPRAVATIGDVIFTCWGTIGQVGWISPKSKFARYLVSNKQMRLRPDSEICDARYLYYFFSSELGQAEILERRIGSSVPGFNLTGLRTINVPLPPLPEQRAIVATLGALDDKIELNRRMCETLEAMARALFRDWFVDFGPTRAKMAGTAPYLSEDLWSLFPDRLDDDGKPEGWAMLALSEVTSELRRGVSPKYVEQGGVRVLNQKCIRNRQVDVAPSRRHDEVQRSVAGRLLQTGDILVNSTGTGTLGRVAQIWKIDEPVVVNSHVTVVRADPQKVSIFYLGICVTGREQEIEALGEGSTGQTELSRARLAQLPILLPSQIVQNAFDNSVVAILERITLAGLESRTLAATRDLLLPRLMSGELRVTDAEPLLQEVL